MSASPTSSASSLDGSAHEVYGLHLESEIDLPDLPRAARGAGELPVRIRRGSVAAGPTSTDLGLGLWADGDTLGFAVPDVARFAMHGGHTVVVDAVPGVADDVVRLFLLGTALGAILVQRGRLVLHGNAFAVGGGCAVVLGHSGAGKSTFAAEVHRRGYAVLSDDVVPVDDDGHALPGFPRIKLWSDAADRAGIPTDGLRRVREGHDKFHVPIERAAATPLPVRWLYVLERHDAPLHLEPVTGAAVFTHLLEHTYRRELLVGEHRARHLARAAALGAGVRLVRVLRPREGDSVAASVDAVLADLADPADPADSPFPHPPERTRA